MPIKEALSAIALTLAALLPYIRDIIQEEIKPHVLSWAIWGDVGTTCVVFGAQLQAGGGAEA